jgi:hypothetical protein
VTKKHRLSKRGLRRVAERDAVALAEDRVKLARLSPGGSPERPLEVETPSVIETRATATPCAVCEASLELRDHEIAVHEGARLRRVRLVCKQCHAPRELWFKLAPSGPN